LVCGQVATDEVAVSAEVKVFVVGKAELKAEATMTFRRLKVAGNCESFHT
jgi:hypothetical protein